ncbi:hypothetical protein EMMF5_005153 [Cystobasidiomycetes sp. EMM_F5]
MATIKSIVAAYEANAGSASSDAPKPSGDAPTPPASSSQSAPAEFLLARSKLKRVSSNLIPTVGADNVEDATLNTERIPLQGLVSVDTAGINRSKYASPTPSPAGYPVYRGLVTPSRGTDDTPFSPVGPASAREMILGSSPKRKPPGAVRLHGLNEKEKDKAAFPPGSPPKRASSSSSSSISLPIRLSSSPPPLRTTTSDVAVVARSQPLAGLAKATAISSVEQPILLPPPAIAPQLPSRPLTIKPVADAQSTSRSSPRAVPARTSSLSPKAAASMTTASGNPTRPVAPPIPGGKPALKPAASESVSASQGDDQSVGGLASSRNAVTLVQNGFTPVPPQAVPPQLPPRKPIAVPAQSATNSTHILATSVPTQSGFPHQTSMDSIDGGGSRLYRSSTVSAQAHATEYVGASRELHNMPRPPTRQIVNDKSSANGGVSRSSTIGHAAPRHQESRTATGRTRSGSSTSSNPSLALRPSTSRASMNSTAPPVALSSSPPPLSRWVSPSGSIDNKATFPPIGLKSKSLRSMRSTSSLNAKATTISSNAKRPQQPPPLAAMPQRYIELFNKLLTAVDAASSPNDDIARALQPAKPHQRLDGIVIREVWKVSRLDSAVLAKIW